MKKKILALTLPIGLMMELVYQIVNRFFIRIPDIIAYPILVVSILLMLIGIVYNVYCFGKHQNPYWFKENDKM